MKKKFIYGGITAVIIVIASYYLFFRSETLKVTYRNEAAALGDVTVEVTSTGTVSPENRVEIKPPVAGRVEEVLVREGQKVYRGQVLARMSSTERAALLDAARSEGPEELKRWQESYKATPILAPINGTIILRSVEAGQTFANTDSVFTLSDRLTVKAQVDETDIGKIKLKQPATLSLDAYPDTKIPAVVDQIAFDAKTVNNVTTYLVDVLPSNVPENMRSGMTANVTFVVAQKTQVLLVPNEALKVDGDKFYVQVDGAKKNEPQSLAVVTGLSDGKYTEIVSGLTEGQQVLIAELNADASKKTSSPFGMPKGPSRKSRK